MMCGHLNHAVGEKHCFAKASGYDRLPGPAATFGPQPLDGLTAVDDFPLPANNGGGALTLHRMEV
jgi:hypothetical protein